MSLLSQKKVMNILARKKVMNALAKRMRVLPKEIKENYLSCLEGADQEEFDAHRLSKLIYRALYQEVYLEPKYPFSVTHEQIENRERLEVIYQGIYGYKEATPEERNTFGTMVWGKPGSIAAYKYAALLKKHSFERD